ncbi:energy-coupling factor transporter ATP-binding protein EcfA1 [Thermocladium modestius]|uniref:Energy-coupling factor transporter ATP-binding protein EcfA1 n=1 Tax=Thermocladium modestius TaxID=62609 RepID=A0A830GXU9_9CREN|nr:ABC transporter ATP-binding protein [Thermocladium modestius]GGP22434.1 energy-coupling factor transporter ATP-binding protein EcfA1 [Thermocladium modestius]
MGVEVTDLWFKYNGADKWTLRGINLGLSSGRLLLLVGKSGAGKSTLIKAIAGLLAGKGEMRGSIRVGKVYPVLQNPENQLLELTVRDELEGVDEDIISAMGILDLMDRPTFELSGGEQQRVVLAKALASGADVLLLDEPTMWLDLDGVSNLLSVIWYIRGMGRAVIVSEHRYHYFLPIADEVALLANGSITFRGPPRDAIESSELSREVGAPLFMKLWRSMGGAPALTVSEIARN